MDGKREEAEDGKGPPPWRDPRLLSAAYTAVIALEARELSTNPQVARWIAAGAPWQNTPEDLGVGGLLIAYLLTQLAFTLTGSELWQDMFPSETAGPLSQAVLKLGVTEPMFSSPLNSEKRDGEYLCAGCGQKLFDASAKFDSGSGWPAFWRSFDAESISYEKEAIGGRMEVRCKGCDGHLGHVFSDGPRVSEGDVAPETDPGGADGPTFDIPTSRHPRFCVNGAALRFYPSESNPEKQGETSTPVGME